MKKSGKQQRSKETIETLLAAAAQVLIDEGYEKATTNRIADRAGFSVGTLYQYFDDKEDIYGELLDRAIAGLCNAAAYCPVQASLAQTLQALLTRVLGGMGANPALVQALGALLAGQFRNKRDVAFESIVASTARLLEAHRQEIAVEDLALAARIVVGATESLANSGSLDHLGRDDLMANALRLQLAYLTLKT